ncbi:hypothetical protein K2X14_04015 [Acetobacter sp. TBRC 12305]|uniref:Uncharacterized protein n=1 Tax=Acetobacter garciniae TaxID=2817435 RepID=A0A939KMA0_9PROT|nr:hypothetical protein [Acetobacter garciniae]MBO1324325.1 hypothetical protein [Acetobacter garciniae]MBX0344014.1 hypothetical protein [Acetobacter garciniae]
MHTLSFILAAAAIGLGLSAADRLSSDSATQATATLSARVLPVSVPSLLPH